MHNEMETITKLWGKSSMLTITSEASIIRILNHCMRITDFLICKHQIYN